MAWSGLDRRVRVRTRALGGGLDTANPVTSFRLVVDNTAGALSRRDLYVAAMASVDKTKGTLVQGSVAGTWPRGSFLRWYDPPNSYLGVLQRDVVWAGNTVSLSNGAQHVDRARTRPVTNPGIVFPGWLTIASAAPDKSGVVTGQSLTDVPIAPPAVTRPGGVDLDVSGVYDADVAESWRWARLLDEVYDQDSVDLEDDATEDQDGNVDTITVPRVTGSSTWLFRFDAAVNNLATLEYDGAVWGVIGTRRRSARAGYMEVEATRQYYGSVGV